MTNEALENIFNRKSVREFTDEKIDQEDIKTIIKAAMSAPSAVNLQPWEFLVFDDEKTLRDIPNIHEYSKMFNTAALGILVCGNLEKTIENFEELWVQDCAASTENILLAIEALGLGGVWLGIYPVDERCERFSKYFNLPENIVPFGLVAVGHPAVDDDAKDKWDENKLHWNKW